MVLLCRSIGSVVCMFICKHCLHVFGHPLHVFLFSKQFFACFPPKAQFACFLFFVCMPVWNHSVVFLFFGFLFSWHYSFLVFRQHFLHVSFDFGVHQILQALFVCFSTSVCSFSEAVFAFLSKGLCWYLICFFCFLFACVLLEALFVCSCCFLKVGMHVFLSVVCFFSKALCLCVSFHCWMIFMFWAAVFACILFVWLIHWLLDVCLHFFCGCRIRFEFCLYAFSQWRSFHNFGACSWLGLRTNVSPSKSPKVESNLETADALAMAWCIRTVCNASQGNGKFPTLHLTRRIR